MGIEVARLSTGSVRFRITRLAVVIVAAVLILVAVAVVVVQQLTLTAALEANLRQQADGLAAQFELAGVPSSLPGADDDAATQLVTMAGDVVAWSDNLAGAAPIDEAANGGESITQVALDTIGGDSFRVLSRRVTIAGEQYSLHVAAASDDVADSVRVLALSLAVAVPLAAILLGVVVWWLVGRALLPVEAIRAEVASVGTDELHRRVPVPADDDEIAALARTMNDMLARVQEGVARQRSFAADASHELRSPLTRIRSELEVDLADPAAADPIDTHRSVLDEARGMEHLVDDLLFLARSDAAGELIHAGEVDLDDLLFDEVGRLRDATTLTFDVSGVSAAQVWGDRNQLNRAIHNLIDNATRHAETKVQMALGERGGWAELTVTDDGPGIPAADVERIFERFARTDESRSRDQGGTGLGLAITADIIHRHSGTIRVDLTYTRGARFEVRIPHSRIARPAQ